MSPLPHGFLEIFTSVRYHRDMKILKILASNSKQIDDDRGGGGAAAKLQQFLR